MNKINLLLITTFSLGLSGCATEPLLKQTQSGKAEGLFKYTSPGDTKDKLVNLCSNIGATVQQASENIVTCTKTLTGGNAFMAQLLIGNSYSTPPESYLHFVLNKQGEDVRVIATEEITTQMAFGQVRRQAMNGNKNKNELQRALATVGAE